MGWIQQKGIASLNYLYSTVTKESSCRTGLARTHPWTTLALVCVAQFMVILDVTVERGAALDRRRPRLAAADLQWVVTAYVLLSGGLGGLKGDSICWTATGLPRRTRPVQRGIAGQRAGGVR